jgi:hypothetical protein
MRRSADRYASCVVRKTLAALAVIGVAACTSSHNDPITNVATSPFSDLNIVQAEIPKILVQARRHPYEMPADTSCEALAAGVLALNEVLGPDIDAPPGSAPSLLERGTSAAGNEAYSAIKGTAEDIVPFRHWVRQLSGAERYSKKVAASIIAGTVRRSFLRGIAAAQGCRLPMETTAEAAPSALPDVPVQTEPAPTAALPGT